VEKHKLIEQRRYDDEAAPFLDREAPRTFGAESAPPEFRPPYLEFERQVLSHAKPRVVVLDIGAGTGTFSFTARGEGRVLVAADISPIALRIARKRADAAGVQLSLVCADAERLPFRDGAVGLVTSAGALYCFDLPALTAEVRRILRPDGAWVIVDSLDDNPLYRINRLIGFLRRRRTALTLRNIPTTAALAALRRDFHRVDITYHGVLTFLIPLLRPILGGARAGKIVSAADRWAGWFRRWAFKVVVVAQRAAS
jgi:SAM-dependent methyltransferase